MVINANSTQTFGVRLLPDALAYARAHSPVTVGVQAYASSPANCEDVPQLAPTYCAQYIFQKPKRRSPAGDGVTAARAGSAK
jgi:hypothetical protein